jgi:glycerate-2-kinase
MEKHKAESARELLRTMFDAAVEAAQPANFIPLHLPAAVVFGFDIRQHASTTLATPWRLVQVSQT